MKPKASSGKRGMKSKTSRQKIKNKAAKMKITILCTYFYPYGETRQNINQTYLASSAPELARYLTKRGHEVVVISRQVPGTKSLSESTGVKIILVPCSDRKGLRLISWHRNARKALRKSEAEKQSSAILCWDWSTTLPALGLGPKGRRAPVLCSVRNSSEAWRNKGRKSFRVYKSFESKAFNGSDLVVYSSNWVKQTVDSVIVVKSPSVVLHHGVDTSMFSPKVSGSKIRKRYGLKPLVVGFFGRLDPVKGIDSLVEACSNLKTPFTLFLVGNGPQRQSLEEKCARLIPGKFAFAGFQERKRIPEFMAACDIIALPSLEEGFSSVVVEALAMGKPFIGTKVGGVPEVINGKNGIKISPGDTESLRRAIESLSSTAKRREMGKLARETAKRYSWKNVVKEWEALLQGASS